MTKRKLRNLEELYGVTEEGSEPKGLSGTEKIFIKHFASGKFITRVESGTRNVCASPCSSCVHLNPALSPMRLKFDNLSDEACFEKATCQCSFSDADSFSLFKSRICNNGHYTSSETSNTLSSCSSHGPYSENAECKPGLRVPVTSEGIAMLSKVAARKVVAKDRGFSEHQSFCGNRIFSNQHQKQKISECNGDEISCISGADSPGMMVNDLRGYIDRKNVSCSSASVNSFRLERFEKATNVHPASSFLSASHYEVEKENKFSRPIKFTEESLWETLPFSEKSNPLETSLSDVCADATSLKDLSECSMEKVELSFARESTSSLEGHREEALDCAKSVKAINEVGPATEALKHSDVNEDLVSLEMPDVLPVQSQTVDCNDGSDLVEDVKVCDICGDAGREESLAICSKCSDGAEHIYCMHTRLDTVPEGDWMCEDCMLQEETELRKRSKFENVAGTLKGSSLNEIHQNAEISSNTNTKTLNIKGSNVEKRKRDEDGSTHFSAKRPVDNSESGSAMKRRALETNVGPPGASRPCRRASLFGDSPNKILDIVKVKAAYDILSFGDQSCNNTPGNACLRTISDHNSPKFRTHPLMSQGILKKSNSFNIAESKLKVRQSDEHILRKKKISRVTATGEKKKDGIVRMVRRSISFKNVSCGQVNAANSKKKIPSSIFSQVEDLKRLRHVKEHNSIRKKCTRKLENPLVSSSRTSSCISVSKNDKKITSHGETLNTPGPKSHDLKAVQHHGSSIDSPKATSHLAQEDSKYPNRLAGSGVLKTLHSCLSVLNGNPSSSTIFDSSHELKPIIAVCKDKLTSASSLTATRDCNGSVTIVQDKVLQSQESTSLDGEVMETSCGSWSEEHISANNRSLNCHKCKNMAHAPESCPIISPRIPVLDAGRPKEADQSNKTDLRPIFCKQFDAATILAIPKLGYIWKGVFEMQSSGRLPRFCYGIQAHLSTCASPKVPEVVKKFPGKVLLEEVPRLSMWPAQFLENHPNEDSIGLYFFAKDLDSYGSDYKSLLECMINYDLALKGNFEGIELLIFSSTVLPEKSQRWNKLFFLWGVFRGRRVNDVDCMPSNQKKTSIPGLNDVSPDQDLSMLAVKSTEILPASKLFYNVHSSTSTYPREFRSLPSARVDVNCILKLSSSEQQYFSSETNFVQHSGSDATISSSTSIKRGHLCRDMQHNNTSLNEHEVPTRRLEDCLTCHRSSHKLNLDCVLQRRGEAYNAEIAEDSRTTDKSLFSAGLCPVDGMLGIKSSRQQVLSSDCEELMKPEFLDLELSLGGGKKLATKVFMPTCLGLADKKNNQDKNPNSVASKKNDDGGGDEFSASLKLNLTLPSYDK